MSKKITHKEHRQLLSELYKKQGGKWIYQADAYIKQQEKQEKLLEKTKEKIIKLTSFIESSAILKYEDLLMFYKEIKELIKELENE